MTRRSGTVSRFIMAGRYRTHYIECGEGQSVILVHGGGPGASGEFGWYKNIDAIGQHGRAIAVDLIGFGLTDKPANIEYSYQTLVRHLADFIDALCLDRVHLVGNSMGAYVVAKYAVDYPDRVSKLLLVGSGTIATAMGLEMPVTPGLQRLVQYDGTRESLRAFLEQLMRHPEQITEEQLDKRYRHAQLPSVMDVQRSLLNYFRHKCREDPNHAQLFDLRHRLPRLTIPMLFVWGRYDIFAPLELAEKLQQLLPNAEFVFFEDSGHVVQHDEPERFNELAIRFFFG